MVTSGAAASAAATAAAIARMREEEEALTPYTEEDLQEEWEFKILRANTAAFKNPQVFQQACQEEARAGWILIEKFDNCRLRFKRPVSAQENDRSLDFDPYRTEFGLSNDFMAAMIIGVVLAIFFLTILFCRVFY